MSGVYVCLQAGGAAQGDQDGGTGNWRGMLRKGEDGMMEDRGRSQALMPLSPQKGYAVNLLDVVGVPLLPVPIKKVALNVWSGMWLIVSKTLCIMYV